MNLEPPEGLTLENLGYFINSFGYYYNPKTDTFSHIYNETFTPGTEWALEPDIWEKHGYVLTVGVYDGHYINQHHQRLNCHTQGNALDEPRRLLMVTKKGMEFVRAYKRQQEVMRQL